MQELRKQFEFFEVILALPLCLLLSLNFVDLHLHSAISKEQVVPSVKHRVWYKQKSFFFFFLQTKVQGKLLSISSRLLTSSDSVIRVLINSFSKLPATPQRQTVNNYEFINYCQLFRDYKKLGKSVQPHLGMRPNLPATYFGANNILESAIFDLRLLSIYT